jgi:methylphosphotriester-DNA--protein-cysteine methyltransferase
MAFQNLLYLEHEVHILVFRVPQSGQKVKTEKFHKALRIFEQSHLNRSIKRIFQITPKEYQKHIFQNVNFAQDLIFLYSYNHLNFT